MHYSKLIKPFRQYDDKAGAACATAPIVVPTAQDTTAEFARLFKEFTERFKPCEAPKDIEDTNLSSDEINEVLSRLLELQDKYFKDLPLSKVLCKKFMWNIPHYIYELSREVQEREEPDMLDPIAWFYMFCVGPMDVWSIGKFLNTCIQNIGEDGLTRLKELSDEYDEYMSEEENEEDEDD